MATRASAWLLLAALMGVKITVTIPDGVPEEKKTLLGTAGRGGLGNA